MMTTNRICPECNKPLIKRIGKRGPFMACTGYPACRHTESIKYENVEPVKVYKPLGKTFKPSSYQQAIYDQFVDSADNILVNATAGSGKTTLLVWLSEFIPQHTSARFLAFNKKIATELASRLPSSV
ncbi:topoisomerase DNA-binding C4 zinc finger domain-containing protein, partial [Candidatus Saccharibacteria bacterium]|nr:topoisomerase DNA-binding C4 zinc finger domain-containing protein [Candidatus Saccharibacteria bacterium]